MGQSAEYKMLFDFIVYLLLCKQLLQDSAASNNEHLPSWFPRFGRLEVAQLNDSDSGSLKDLQASHCLGAVALSKPGLKRPLLSSSMWFLVRDCQLVLGAPPSFPHHIP